MLCIAKETGQTGGIQLDSSEYERWSDFRAGTKLVRDFHALATLQEAMRIWPDDRNVARNYRMSITIYRILFTELPRRKPCGNFGQS